MDVSLIQAGYNLIEHSTFDMAKAHAWLSESRVWQGTIGLDLVVDPMLRGMVLSKWTSHWVTPSENPKVLAQGQNWGMQHLLSYMDYSWSSEHATEHYYRLGAFIEHHNRWDILRTILLDRRTLLKFWEGLTKLEKFTPDTRRHFDGLPLTDLNDYLRYQVYNAIVINGLEPASVIGLDEFWGIISPEKVPMVALDNYNTEYESLLLDTFAKQVKRLIALTPGGIGFAIARCINYLEGNLTSKWLQTYKPIFEMSHSHLLDEEWIVFLLSVYTAHDDNNPVSQQILAWCLEAWPLEFKLIQAAGLVYDHATLHGSSSMLTQILEEQRRTLLQNYEFSLPALED